MIGVGDQNISDQEFAEGVWQRLIEFREWCRSKAWEYLKSHPRRK